MNYKFTKLNHLLGVLLVVVCFVFSGFFQPKSLDLKKRKGEPIPKWMTEQINTDLKFFQEHAFSKKEFDALFHSEKGNDLRLVLFTIHDNHVSYEAHPVLGHSYHRRAKKMASAFARICNELNLPDMQFILSLHDSVDFDTNVPLFVMAKSRKLTKQILVPDFDAVQGRFQVIKKKDLTTYCVPWQRKKSQLIWRGSTAQSPVEVAQGKFVLTRITLCELSKAHPELIDAKFTSFAQMKEPLLSSLQPFKGEYLPYEDLMNYKYQLLIDGNTCAYTNSCWKLFAGSVLFKPDSEHIQWYYNSLKPNEHYIPVKADLSDLVEKVKWAQEHDKEAAAIASNARAFACQYLKQADSMMYFYYLLQEYSKIKPQP